MRVDRAEWAGAGAAVVFHALLIGALSLSLARVASAPEMPSMEVEFVEDVGLTAAAPTPIASPPPTAQSPNIEEDSPPEAEPAPAPTPAPLPPAPKVVPTPAPRATERATARPSPPRPAPSKPAPRASRLGDDFLKGIDSDDAPAKAAPKASAPRFDAAALAGIQQAIRRQIQPCADRQVDPGPGANRIRVTLNLRLTRSGRLARPPQVVRTAGVDDENGRFEERVKDLAVAAYVGCAPLTGLPEELYSTPDGGWANINMTYRLP